MSHEPSIGPRPTVLLAIVDPDDSATVAKLRAILPGRRLVAVPPLAEISGAGVHGEAAMRAAPRLTPRQQAILTLLLRNLSNKEIGRALSISHFTVRNHVSQLLRILGCPSRKVAIATFMPPAYETTLNA